jgi:LuxR family maltose regulon positive regulatory protein
VDDLALPPQLRTAIGQAVAIRGVLARQRGEVEAALPLAARALALLPESEGPLRAIVTAHLGLAQMQSGAADQADAAFEEAVRAARRGGDGFLLNSSLCLQAGQHLERGRPHAARRLYIEALARAEAAGLPGLTLLPRTRLAWLHYHWNELDTAETHLDAAVRVALPDVPAAALVHVHLVRARARQARGDAAGADEALAAAERLTADHHLPQMTALVLAWQARLWLLRGEVAVAGRWAETAGLWRLQSSTGWDAPRDLPADLALTTGCLWLIARAEPASLALAGDLLEARLRPADPASLPLAALEYWRLRALLAQARGHTPEAAAALGEALALAEPMGFLRLFLDDGPALRPALAQLAGRRSPQTLAHRLLALLPPRASPLADPLNPHELAILRLLARGHSSADIARERVLAISTVRWYLKHIYQKLGVHNRTQAADRARQLNLL